MDPHSVSSAGSKTVHPRAEFDSSGLHGLHMIAKRAAIFTIAGLAVAKIQLRSTLVGFPANSRRHSQSVRP